MSDSDRCPKCGAEIECVGDWLDPIMPHKPGSPTCLRNQLAAVTAERDELRERCERAERERDEARAK